MPHRLRGVLVALVVLVTLSACGGGSGQPTAVSNTAITNTASPSAPNLSVSDAWVRPAAVIIAATAEPDTTEVPAPRVSSAAYLKIKNTGGTADRLMRVETDGVQVVELHSTTQENGVMRMNLVDNGIDVPANGTLELAPGGYHAMLIGLKRDLKVGDQLELHLFFQTTGAYTVTAQVQSPEK